MSLLSLGIKVLAIVGLGMAPLVDQSLPIPGYGEMAQGTGTTAREFTLVSALYGDGQNGRHLQAQRSDIIDAFKPDLTTVDQPLILRYQAVDDEGDAMGDCLDIVCKYRSGLEGNWDNHQQERIALQFKMYLPYIQNTFDSGMILNYQTNVANANYILQRSQDGIWAEMAGGTNGIVYGIAEAQDGSIYVVGDFINLGDANGDHISKWNGNSWSSLGTGTNGTVTCIAIAQDGSIYIGGSFTLAGGVAGTNRIAKWDGSVWSPLSSGLLGDCNAISITNSGIVYVSGSADPLVLGVPNSHYIAQWNGAAWSAIGTGTNGMVSSILVDPFSNNIYFAGGFTSASGVAANNVVKYNGGTWTSLGSGANNGVNNSVYCLFLSNGTLYVGGIFTSAGGVSVRSIAAWNGTSWSNMGGGVQSGTGVYRIILGPDNLIYASGLFDVISGVSIKDGIATWNGSNWSTLDVDFPGNATILSMLYSRSGIFYTGFNTSGTAVSAVVSSVNIGSASVYPSITYTGPGTVWILKNYTTKRSIYFNLTLWANEVAVLNLSPYHLSFTSNLRGNILGTIIKNSFLDFFLTPGVNSISSYLYGSTFGTTSVVMSWNPQYWSIDGATLK